MTKKAETVKPRSKGGYQTNPGINDCPSDLRAQSSQRQKGIAAGERREKAGLLEGKFGIRNR